jgi:hypothetical protein
MRNQIDLTDKKFTRLTALHLEPLPPTEFAYVKRWVCRCDCGKTVVVSASNLRSRSVKSCGCLRAESAKKCRSLYGYIKGEVCQDS